MDTEKKEIQEVETQAIQTVDPGSPMALAAELCKADSNMSIEKMEKILEMQERFEANQARKAYHVAMANFLAESPRIIKTKEGHNCKYAGLSDIVLAIAPLLSSHGLSHSWETRTADKEITVSCKITHVLGHSERTGLSAGPDASGSKNAIQAVGSTITYLQRYTLKAALGLAEAGQDDDGAGAGDDKLKIPKPNEQESKVLDQICNLLIDSVPEGKILLESKVTEILYSITDKHPSDMAKAGTAAAWLISHDKMNVITKGKDEK